MITTLLEKLTRTNTESFAIAATNGNTWFVEANRCKLRGGNLIFWTGWNTVVAVVGDGAWSRIQRGITLEDFEKGGAQWQQ